MKISPSIQNKASDYYAYILFVMNEENIHLMVQPLIHDFIYDSEGSKFYALARYYIIKIQVHILRVCIDIVRRVFL